MRFQLVPFSQIDNHRSDLIHLCENALDETMCLDPDFLYPAMHHLGKGKPFLACVFGDGSNAMLCALPVMKVGRFGLFWRPLTAWRHDYAMLGFPVLHRRTDASGFAKLMEGLGSSFKAKAFYMPYIAKDSMFGQWLNKQTSFPYQSIQTIERAAVQTSLAPDAYFKQHISPKRLKEWRRQRKKLQELGKLQHKITTGEDAAIAAKRFLELENKGWKRKSGTAIACLTDDKTFYEAATAQLARSNSLRVDELWLDETLIASLVSISGTKWLSTWKIAYDETYSQYSPGLLVMESLTRSILEYGKPIHIDSLADPDHPMVDRLWKERRILEDVVISLTGKKSLSFYVTFLIEKMRLKAKARLKRSS
jgi:hypothetical protein